MTMPAAEQVSAGDAAEAHAAASQIAEALAIPHEPGQLRIAGEDRVLPVRYPLGIAGAGVFGACGLALADLAALRGAPPQPVDIDVAHAALGQVGFRQVRLDGQPIGSPGDANPMVGIYRCRDGAWIAIHGGFPTLSEPTLRVLGSAGEFDAIAAAIARRDSGELEEALAAERQCGVVCRTAADWQATPAGAALLHEPLVAIARIGDAEPAPLATIEPRSGAMHGVRVLDFTRILAGPTCGRFLAAAGADVVVASTPRLPNMDNYALETSHGKRFADVDLDDAQGLAAAQTLAARCDVLVDSYRTGALERRGLGPRQLAQGRRRGVIYVSINCYGYTGPWTQRPGWELMGQAATGLAVGHGGADRPLPLWCYPCDYLTGYLAGLGVARALVRRAREGGSWHVKVSLARTGMYTESFGPRYDPPPAARDIAAAYCREADTPRGRLRYLPVPITLSATPLHGWQPAVQLARGELPWH
jgi:crotonobetainyl-CoA:carnitine CoA-transferase CaiB-like acyl-CoA transferase